MTDTIAIICFVSGILLILSAWIDGSKSDYAQQREDDDYDDEYEYEDEYYDEDEDVITEAEVVEIESNEETQVKELIEELKSKPDKSKKDQYNIELLEVKLRQLKNRK
jgi:hypothetical protein